MLSFGGPGWVFPHWLCYRSYSSLLQKLVTGFIPWLWGQCFWCEKNRPNFLNGGSGGLLFRHHTFNQGQYFCFGGFDIDLEDFHFLEDVSETVDVGVGVDGSILVNFGRSVGWRLGFVFDTHDLFISEGVGVHKITDFYLSLIGNVNALRIDVGMDDSLFWECLQNGY